VHQGERVCAELAAANPEAGGLRFIRDGFGRMPAFLYGWCLFLVNRPAAPSQLSRAFTRYLHESFPEFDRGPRIVSVAMIACHAVNVWGTRKSSDLQNWTTLIKVGIS